MFQTLLILELIIAFSLIVVVLLQKNEGGILGMGGNQSGLFSTRGSASFLTRVTAVLAALFMLTNLLLAYISAKQNDTPSVIESIVPSDLDIPSLVVPQTPNSKEVPIN